MADKMLIDASHEEETRVVVVRGNRIEEFDFESQHKKQIRGNIYLAKVTRVEPSLQAAFVDYGGNRHGFLAFSEIHPDYYQIPVADRQALIAQEEREQREADEEQEQRRGSRRRRHRQRGAYRNRERDAVQSEPLAEHAADGAPVEGTATHERDDVSAAPEPVSEIVDLPAAGPVQEESPAPAEAGPADVAEAAPEIPAPS